MSTLQSSAAARAGTSDPRAKARTTRSSSEEPVAEESLRAHARRALRSRLSAAATGVLDPGIALLQRLRTAAGGVQETETDEDRPRSRNDRSNGRRDAAADPVEAAPVAPKPRRRLRAFLVYLGVLLAGGMGGGVLAFDLLAKLLDRQSEENRRLEERIAKYSKATDSIQKNLDDAQVQRIDAQTGRSEAEKNLAASLAENKASSAEQKKKLEAMEKRLELMLASEHARVPPQLSKVSAGNTGRTARPAKTGNCALGAGNFSVLKNCIDEFNR